VPAGGWVGGGKGFLTGKSEEYGRHARTERARAEGERLGSTEAPLVYTLRVTEREAEWCGRKGEPETCFSGQKIPTGVGIREATVEIWVEW
jgi:hypothetical protein